MMQEKFELILNKHHPVVVLATRCKVVKAGLKKLHETVQRPVALTA